jgi:hypothetical protein
LYRSIENLREQSGIRGGKTGRIPGIPDLLAQSEALLVNFSDTRSPSIGRCNQFPIHGRQTPDVRSVSQNLSLEPKQPFG